MNAPANYYLPGFIDPETGDRILQAGKVGAIVLAGGQASRLGIEAPKGTLGVTSIKQKSLFQLFCEKTAACSKKVGRDLPLAFMTSAENGAATRAFFKAHDSFGLQAENCTFFQQSNLTLIDEETRAPLGLTGPDGNGSLFWNFRKIAAEWEARGIEYVTVSLIDNALTDPWNRDLIALSSAHKNDVTVVAVERTLPDEKVGLLVQNDQRKLRVVEYTEMSPKDKEARDSDGHLTFRLANISTFCFSLAFMKKMSSMPIEVMPQHAQKKFSRALQKWVIKSEYFIFDAIPFAEKVDLLLLKREDVFAPLKNSSGADSLETVQKALLERDRKLYEAISGTKVAEERQFELSVDFQYPTEELKKRFHRKPLLFDGYVA